MECVCPLSLQLNSELARTLLTWSTVQKHCLCQLILGSGPPPNPTNCCSHCAQNQVATTEKDYLWYVKTMSTSEHSHQCQNTKHLLTSYLAIFGIFVRAKYGQVGCPWKYLAKCSSDTLVLGQTDPPVKSYNQISFLARSPHSYLIFVIFFTRAKFLENEIYTEKRQFFALNLSKMPIFRVKSVKIYTGQKKFTRIYPWDPWQIWGMGRP